MYSKRAFFAFTCQLHENLYKWVLFDFNFFSPPKSGKIIVDAINLQTLLENDKK